MSYLAHLWPISLQNLSDLDIDLSRSLRSNVITPIDPIYAFLLMLNCNICTNSAPLWDIMIRNMNDHDTDLSRSLKVKCDSVIRLLIYAFLLMFNSNIWPNSAPLQDYITRLTLTFQGHSRSNVSSDSPYRFPIDIHIVITRLSLNV